MANAAEKNTDERARSNLNLIATTNSAHSKLANYFLFFFSEVVSSDFSTYSKANKTLFTAFFGTKEDSFFLTCCNCKHIWLNK